MLKNKILSRCSFGGKWCKSLNRDGAQLRREKESKYTAIHSLLTSWRECQWRSFCKEKMPRSVEFSQQAKTLTSRLFTSVPTKWLKMFLGTIWRYWRYQVWAPRIQECTLLYLKTLTDSQTISLCHRCFCTHLELWRGLSRWLKVNRLIWCQVLSALTILNCLSLSISHWWQVNPKSNPYTRLNQAPRRSSNSQMCQLLWARLTSTTNKNLFCLWPN